jgi:hypothetical protein
MSAMLCPFFAYGAPWDQTQVSMWGFCEFWCLYEVIRSFLRVPLLCMLRQSAMAAQNRRNRTMDDQRLECLVDEFEERFQSEPARF